ncbi:patatin-like phospholipase family protein [Luteimonas sp. A649]
MDARRQKAGVSNDPPGPWGLALSGGGIRSATFCLGLVRGLARTGLLRHFDYLSTVSGGGYLGASLGRLYSGQTDAAQVEEGVASDHSMWLWWLRNNGRYLTPAGAKDLGFATASIVRGVISTHLEIGILVLAMAALVLLPHFLVSLFPPFHAGTFWNHELASTMPSVWGWLLLLPLFACVHQVCAYWYTRDPHTVTSAGLIGVVVAACIAFSGKAGMDAAEAAKTMGQADATSDAHAVVKLIFAFLVLAPVTAAISHARQQLRGIPPSTQRLVRTKRLSYGLWALAIAFLLLLLDWTTWQLTRLFWSGDVQHAVTRLGGTILVVAAVGRLVLPELQRWMATSKGPSLNLERILNIIGIALGLLLAVLWTALLSVLIFPEATRLAYWGPGAEWSKLWDGSPLPFFVLVCAVCALYILATLRSYDLLNLASLHNFYRARIERAYVSSGNCGPDGGGRFGGCALDPVSPERTSRIAPLTEAVPGDDIDLGEYRPHEYGGPIHLVNCCINQSVDDRTGLYNADRKGVAIAVSSLGVELGTNFPDGDTGTARRAKLSQWIAISGAAASTGMGSRTSTGFAALLFMSGIRLGYWMPSLVKQAAKGPMDWLLAKAPKPAAVVAESLARFPGLASPVWYLSDGGHFDNTGIHALLKRRAPVIVAADCGADPKYLFADLESLVRKAKIDYCARIEFIRPGSGVLPEPLDQILGTPETIQPGLGKQWLVLGRISYDDGGTGALLVVKPRRMDAMPFDMVAYADRAPDFPQQTTGDQFFDEAQWESYHQLGLLMGEAVTPALIADALAVVRSDKLATSSLEDAEKQSAASALAVAKSDRSKRAGLTARATLGAGLSLSLLVAAWQGIEQYREARRDAQGLYEEQALVLSQRIQGEPVEALLEEEFAQVANGSALREDGRFQVVLDRLAARCDSLADADDASQCVALHRKVAPLVKYRPQPYYDYWFADKRFAYDDAVSARDAEDAAAAAAQGAADAAAGAAADPAPPPPAPADTLAAPPAPCADGVRLFLHAYDAGSIPYAQAEGARLAWELGAPPRPVDNVVETASRRGTAPPFVWTRTAVVYPANSSPACVARARAAMGDAVRMQPIGFGTPDTFELWIPPRTVASPGPAATQAR